MSGRLLDLVKQEKFLALEQYIKTKLAATWMEILAYRKVAGVDIDESEQFALLLLIDFVIETMHDMDMSREEMLAAVTTAFDDLKKKEEEEDTVE
jgi:hypothetical protein